MKKPLLVLALLSLSLPAFAIWPFGHKYTLTVIACGCQTSGSYRRGTVIQLSAVIPQGMAFDQWDALPSDTAINRVSQASATLVMPAHAVYLRARFAPLPPSRSAP